MENKILQLEKRVTELENKLQERLDNKQTIVLQLKGDKMIADINETAAKLEAVLNAN